MSDAVGDAPGGPPVARRPSSWFVWGWRAALLVLVLLAALPTLTDPGAWRDPSTVLVVRAGLAAAGLLLGGVTVWVVAARPRVTIPEVQAVRARLPRAHQRRLRRALRRGEPLDPADRVWAPAWLRAQQHQLLQLALMVAFLGAIHDPTSARDEASVWPWLSAASLVVIVGYLLGMLALTAAGFRSARRSGIALDDVLSVEEALDADASAGT